MSRLCLTGHQSSILRYMPPPSVQSSLPGFTFRNRKYAAWALVGAVPGITSNASFLVPFCLAMRSVMVLKNASSICTMRSRIWVSWGKRARNRPYQRRTQSSERPEKAQACRMGTRQVQHHRRNQNAWYGSFMSESQVWERSENFSRHARHRYRFSYRATLFDRQTGQNTFLPKTTRRTYFLI